jgi:hypothetical protein
MSWKSSSQTESLSHAGRHRTKHSGNAAITLRSDGKVCAVGGWDGKYVLDFIAPYVDQA